MGSNDKVIDIAAQILSAEVANGTRSHFIYDWSESKMQKLANASVKMAEMIVAAAANNTDK